MMEQSFVPSDYGPTAEEIALAKANQLHTPFRVEVPASCPLTAPIQLSALRSCLQPRPSHSPLLLLFPSGLLPVACSGPHITNDPLLPPLSTTNHIGNMHE